MTDTKDTSGSTDFSRYKNFISADDVRELRRRIIALEGIETPEKREEAWKLFQTDILDALDQLEDVRSGKLKDRGWPAVGCLLAVVIVLFALGFALVTWSQVTDAAQAHCESLGGMYSMSGVQTEAGTEYCIFLAQ